MTATHHESLAAGRWHRLSISEQLGNVGSEVERALRARNAGNEARFRSAVARALELFDLTAADPRWKGHRRREVLRAREQFCAVFWGDNDVSPDSIASLTKYFLYFAQRARSEAVDST